MQHEPHPTRFQLRAKNVALTYPQCDMDKRACYDALRLLCGDNLVGLIVAAERHADGNPHLHCYLRFLETFSTRDPRHFDLDGHHPNAQSCRSPRAWIRYCFKEDPEPLYFGVETPAEGGSGQRLSDVIARRLESGETMAQVCQTNPGFLLLNMRKALEFQSFVARESLRREKSDWSLVSRVSPGNDDCRPVAEWLSGNLRKERPLRSKQLWLYSPPGAGKTTMVMELEKYLMVYWVPMDFDFMEGFDDHYDLIVFDEMKSQKKLTWLNHFIVGSPMIVNVKGGSVQKKRNTPVIFLSNVHPVVAYNKDTPQRDAFIDRLIVIEVREVRITLELLDLNE